MEQNALFHVGKVRDLVLGKRLFQFDRVGGDVGKQQGNIAVAEGAAVYFLFDHRGDEGEFVLLVRGLVHGHGVTGKARFFITFGIEKRCAQFFRRRATFARKHDLFHFRAAFGAIFFKGERRFVGIDLFVSADKNTRDRVRAPDRRADARRRLFGKGGKTDEKHVRAAHLFALFHRRRQERQNAALVEIAARQKIQIFAVDKGDIFEFFC